VVKHRCVRDSLAASTIVAVESLLHNSLLSTYRRHLDKVVVPSRFFRDKFVEWGWPAGQFEYIPNYVDATRFTPDFEPGDYFLYFGRLAPEKGVATLLEAAAQAGVRLKVVGTGPEDAALQQLNAERGGQADFLGYRSGDELHGLIRGALAVVLPSEWYENAPMSVLESFALGKPVIGARIGGIPEMVVEGQSGWTFESRNTQELAETLKKIQHIPKVSLAALGRSARAFVEETFSRAKYVRATLALYASLGVKA
jgi:glycosyltransferase involved in cell wall biosynthesis